MNTTPKFHRPSTIDKWLSNHPEHREAVTMMMLDRGRSVDDVLARLIALGCPTSRSATARHRLLFYRDRSGPKQSDRVYLMELLARVPDGKISAVIEAVVKLLPES
jgi:hypothetical protein